jgi:excisionase family DNA binding protein
MGGTKKSTAVPDELRFPVAGGDYGEETSQALLLTVKEAARLMRIGRDTAYALVAEGRIPSVRLGGTSGSPAPA